MYYGEKIEQAMKLIEQYGHVDGEHHKQWLLDQVARVLMGSAYEGWAEPEEGGWEWDVGIAP